jgi:hypothetical protein
MATNEELQAQIDVLRAALGAVPGLQVQDKSTSAARLTGPQLIVWAGREFKERLDEFDDLRRSVE